MVWSQCGQYTVVTDMHSIANFALRMSNYTHRIFEWHISSVKYKLNCCSKKDILILRNSRNIYYANIIFISHTPWPSNNETEIHFVHHHGSFALCKICWWPHCPSYNTLGLWYHVKDRTNSDTFIGVFIHDYTNGHIRGLSYYNNLLSQCHIS